MKKMMLSVFSIMALILLSTVPVFAQQLIPGTHVPEPGTLILVGLGAAGLGLYKKFKK
jgi:hypothetical protein